MQVSSSGSSVKVLIIDTSTNADLFFNLEEWLVLQPRPRDQAIQTLLVHGLHAAKTILPASPTLATLNKELSAVAYSLKLEKVRLADALELEKVRLADALELEKVRLADALKLEKERLADDLQLEKTRFADALEKERRDSVVAVQRERSALSSVLEMRVRAGIAEGCAEERVQLRNVEANLASLRDREIEKEVARKTDDTKALRMQLADLEREMDILRRSNSARGAVGEERIASFLRREWPKSEVRDMSKSPHTCDIWWFASPSSFIAVEVKNKGVVTRSDVERFESDVANISERNGRAFIGGVFADDELRELFSNLTDVCREMDDDDIGANESPMSAEVHVNEGHYVDDKEAARLANEWMLNLAPRDRATMDTSVYRNGSLRMPWSAKVTRGDGDGDGDDTGARGIYVPWRLFEVHGDGMSPIVIDEFTPPVPAEFEYVRKWLSMSVLYPRRFDTGQTTLTRSHSKSKSKSKSNATSKRIYPEKPKVVSLVSPDLAVVVPCGDDESKYNTVFGRFLTNLMYEYSSCRGVSLAVDVRGVVVSTNNDYLLIKTASRFCLRL
eukprot:gene27835-7204_t